MKYRTYDDFPTLAWHIHSLQQAHEFNPFFTFFDMGANQVPIEIPTQRSSGLVPPKEKILLELVLVEERESIFVSALKFTSRLKRGRLREDRR